MERIKWMWLQNETNTNTWMCFVRDFFCETVPKQVKVRIAADSKYWLYINGNKLRLGL